VAGLAAHFSLMIVAFLAATLLPGSSEAALVALIAWYPASTVTLFAVATAGNIAGATLNWWLGCFLHRFVGRRWFPANVRQINQAAGLFTRYGSWVLLFSWLPIIGDPLTLVAGLLRVRFAIFLALVAIGKAARYGALILGLDLFSRFA
jgi:membrane protein YqaA with SNARE-associated domain